MVAAWWLHPPLVFHNRALASWHHLAQWSLPTRCMQSVAHLPTALKSDSLAIGLTEFGRGLEPRIWEDSRSFKAPRCGPRMSFRSIDFRSKTLMVNGTRLWQRSLLAAIKVGRNYSTTWNERDNSCSKIS
ncbi:hypothetical protein B0H12DRAFT_208325 [Mycena haematopus]|nr:hypothetical protein B0H12DRAFT_208325 [Mycena haematopus]